MKIEKYLTPFAIKEMQENKVSLKTIGMRLMQGCSIEEAFSFKIRGKSKYPDWALAKAKKNGISRQLLHYRVEIQGMSTEEAVSKPKRQELSKT
jgi:hypothetical protein